MSEKQGEKKLEVDDQWKQQAEAEKAKLSGSEQAGAATPPASGGAGAAPRPGPAPARPKLPPASFGLLVEEYVTQILLALGAIKHPATGKTMRDLELAKHYIDVLGVLEEKTKGNLTADEQKLLDTALYEMRMTYVNAARVR